MTDKHPATPPRLPWERQPGETEAAYRAFTTYRDLEPPRSFREAARRIGKAHSTLAKHARRHNWYERIEEYDNHLTRQQQQAALEGWRLASAQHAEMVGAVRTKLRARLLGQGATELDAEDLGWADVARLLRETVVLDRIVHGHPGDLALRATLVEASVAVDHIRTLVDIARHHMDDETFRRFLLDYRAAVGLIPDQGERPMLGP